MHPSNPASFTQDYGCHVPRLRGHVRPLDQRRSRSHDMPTQAWDMAPERMDESG